MERDDEQQVQPDVQHRGEQEEQQRRDRIAQAAQEGADEVVEQLRADAGEDDRAVGERGAIDLAARGREVDPGEHRVQQHERQRRERDGQCRGEDDLCRERAAHGGLVMRADAPRRHRAEARADAEGELQEDERDGGRVVHARDLIRRERLADDGRVADRVDLLEQIGNDDRDGKQKDGLPAGALGQVDGLEEGKSFFRHKITCKWAVIFFRAEIIARS